jgi:hypothetical protein
VFLPSTLAFIHAVDQIPLTRSGDTFEAGFLYSNAGLYCQRRAGGFMHEDEIVYENLELALELNAAELLRMAEFYKRRDMVNKVQEVEQLVREIAAVHNALSKIERIKRATAFTNLKFRE